MRSKKYYLLFFVLIGSILIPMTSLNIFLHPIIPKYASKRTIMKPNTLDAPSLDNVTSSDLNFRLSAIQNILSAKASSIYNETFFDVMPVDTANFTLGIISFFSNIQDKINGTAPEPFESINGFTYMTMPPAQAAIEAMDYSFNNSAMFVHLIFNETTTDRCNKTLDQVVQQLINLLNANGIELSLISKTIAVEYAYGSLSQFFGMSSGYWSIANGTHGFAILSVSNTSREVYDFITNSMLNDTYEKNIAEKGRSSTHKSVALFDACDNRIQGDSKNASMAFSTTIFRNEMVSDGEIYNFSVRNLLNIPVDQNLTSIPGAPFTVQIHFPINANITSKNPSDMSQFGFSLTANIPTPPGIYDVNVSYDILNENEHCTLVIIDHTMTNSTGNENYNLNPGDWALYNVTIKNFGATIANGSVIFGLSNTSVYDFAPSFPTPPSSFLVPPGENITLTWNLTANNKGIMLTSCYLIQTPGAGGYINIPMGVNYTTGPLLVPFLNWSNWLVTPGSIVNSLLTLKNFGEDAQNLEFMYVWTVGLLKESNISARIISFPGTGDVLYLNFSNIASGESKTANMTYLTELGTWTHTGNSPYCIIAITYPEIPSIGLSSVTLPPAPVSWPAFRPANSIYLEIQRDPAVIEGNPGDEVAITIRLRNLGIETISVNINETIPSGTELIEGENVQVVTLSPGEEVILVVTVRITGSGGGGSGKLQAKANGGSEKNIVPLPTIKLLDYYNSSYTLGLLGLINTPQAFCSKVNVRLPSSSFLNITLSGYATLFAKELSTNPVSGAPPGAESIGWFLDVTIDNSSAFQSMTITVNYNETAVLNAGLDEESLTLYYWDGGTWIALDCTVNTTSNTITAVVTHLSYFTLGGPSSGIIIPILPGIAGTDMIMMFFIIIGIVALCVVVTFVIAIKRQKSKTSNEKEMRKEIPK
ncbi:MAG: COG1470 family protein [Candidatus Helarchaeota archaeon]